MNDSDQFLDARRCPAHWTGNALGQCHLTEVNGPRRKFQGSYQRSRKASLRCVTEVPVYALDRPVIAKTAYTGAFDVHLEFSPGGAAPIGVAPVPNPDNNSSTIFTALPEQLGPKLESQKGPADLLLVDHVEKPSEN